MFIISHFIKFRHISSIIIGGIDAKMGEFPFLAAIGKKFNTLFYIS